MDKVICLNGVRHRIDRMNEDIVSGLKNRSQFSLNKGVFEKNFADSLTWFMYRLRSEQSIDAEFGRYLYPDQTVLWFKQSDLPKPKVQRTVQPIHGLRILDLDVGKEILKEYQWILEKICKKGEHENEYGEVAKIDADMVLKCNERILGMGRQVAEYKLEHEPKLRTCQKESELLAYIVNSEREAETIQNAIAHAKKVDIQNPVAVGEFISRIIKITRKVEIAYIQQVQKEMTRKGV